MKSVVDGSSELGNYIYAMSIERHVFNTYREWWCEGGKSCCYSLKMHRLIVQPGDIIKLVRVEDQHHTASAKCPVDGDYIIDNYRHRAGPSSALFIKGGDINDVFAPNKFKLISEEEYLKSKKIKYVQ